MTEPEPPLFSFDDVTVPGEHRPRLDRVTLDVPDGALTVVVGPSGSGKSTLLRLANVLDVPERGAVRYRGTDLAGVDVPQHRRRVGMLFQQAVVFPGTVHDNLRVADHALDAAACRELLDRVRVSPELLDRDAETLSGGEAQRVCLARVLATQPEALLLDEPTSALDPSPRLALEALARELRDDGVPIVWVTHALDQMERLADGIVLLVDGHVIHAARRRPFVAGADETARHFLEAMS